MKDEKDEDVIVAGIVTPNKEPLVEIFQTSTDSLTIASDTIGLSGIGPTPEYLELVTEQVDRGKFHGKGTIKIAGVEITFERQPSKEVKTTTKVIFRKPKL